MKSKKYKIRRENKWSEIEIVRLKQLLKSQEMRHIRHRSNLCNNMKKKFMKQKKDLPKIQHRKELKYKLLNKSVIIIKLKKSRLTKT